tara:strand:+ start:325 stop:639 length:315 start_codon:yes stop_codon:yes gene_type:complete
MEENNKLIAEFMGYEVKHNKCYSPKYNDGTIAPMQFHKSWDWLMPVIDKIETMGCEVVHRVGDCNIYKIDEQENYRCIIEIQGINKLESTYKAIVVFIKNHEIL